MAWTGRAAQGNKVNRLGGAWVGDDGRGFRLNHVQIPLDPEGKTAIAHITITTHGGPWPFGINAFTDANGLFMMTGKDTAVGSTVSHALRIADPLVFSREIVGTLVVSMALTFLDPDTIEGYWWTRFYPFDGVEMLPSGGPDPTRAGPAIMRRVPFVPPPDA